MTENQAKKLISHLKNVRHSFFPVDQILWKIERRACPERHAVGQCSIAGGDPASSLDDSITSSLGSAVWTQPSALYSLSSLARANTWCLISGIHSFILAGEGGGYHITLIYYIKYMMASMCVISFFKQTWQNKQALSFKTIPLVGLICTYSTCTTSD